MKHGKEAVHRRVLCAIISVILLCAAEDASFAQGVPLSTYLEMQSGYRNSLHSGIVKFDYKRTTTPSENEIAAAVAQLEEQKRAALSEPNNPESLRKKLAAQYDIRIGQYKNRETYSDMNANLKRVFSFDQETDRYRDDQEPQGEKTTLEDLAQRQLSAPSNVKTTNLASGNLFVSYLPDLKTALVDQRETTQMDTSPAFFGVIDAQKVGDNYRLASNRNEVIDGHAVVAYEFVNLQFDNDSMTVFADPALGFRYRRVEYRTGDFVRQVITAADFEQYGDVLYPMRHESVMYSQTADGASEERTREVVQVLSAQFNMAIDPSAFLVTFAPGTMVNDRNLGIVTKIGDQGYGPQGVESIAEMLLPQKLEEEREKQSSSLTAEIKHNMYSPDQTKSDTPPAVVGHVVTPTLAIAAACTIGLLGLVVVFVRRSMRNDRNRS